ncbi:MAG: preprotein translocase subunit SecE [Pyrinomonadaceae bacterium]
MAKNDKEFPGRTDDAAVLPVAEPPPNRSSSSDVPAGDLPAPRMARFGEGQEGGGARRERGENGPRDGFFTRIGQFLHDVRIEMRRVSWPSATQVKNTTIITLIAVIFFAIYLYTVDKVFVFLLGQLESLVNWLLGGA